MNNCCIVKLRVQNGVSLVVEHFYGHVLRNWWFCLWKRNSVKIAVAGKTMEEKGKQ